MTLRRGPHTAAASAPRPIHRIARVVAGGLLVALVAAPALAGAVVSAPFVARSSADDQLAAARTRLDAAEARLVALEKERAGIEADHATLNGTQLTLVRQLEDALRDTRQFAVEAYVAGGPNASVGEVLDAATVAEAIWRSAILAGQTSYGLEKAGQLRDLLGRADSAVRQIALRSDQNRRKVEAATLERFFASIANKQAEQRLAAERAPVFVTSDAPEGSLAEAWAKLRQCESSGNYRVVSPSGLYRGAYQFDLRTWAAVGGEGDPIDASPAEQDLRAQILYDRRGRQPWPVCGRFLP